MAHVDVDRVGGRRRRSNVGHVVLLPEHCSACAHVEGHRPFLVLLFLRQTGGRVGFCWGGSGVVVVGRWWMRMESVRDAA